MKKYRHHISQSQRDRIFASTGGACYYCGYAATCLDHIVPHSYVANDTDANLVPACDICNKIAGNKHFASLHAKQKYILDERVSEHWQRKIGRMIVTVIRNFYGDPLPEPESTPIAPLPVTTPYKHPLRKPGRRLPRRVKQQVRVAPIVIPAPPAPKSIKQRIYRLPPNAVPRPRVWGRAGRRVTVWD